MKLNLSSLLFAGGTYSVWFLPWLIPLPISFLTSLAGLGVVLVSARLLPLSLFFIGLSWGIYHSNQLDRTQIPAAHSGIEARISGTIASIPQHRGISQRFEFHLDSYRTISGFEPIEAPEKVFLSWYQTDKTLRAGENYQFDVKLRRPRGLSNFGMFDYRRWLLGQGFDATGYVRSAYPLDSGDSWAGKFNRIRVDLLTEVSTHGFRYEEFILALGVGIKEAIQTDQWQLFLETGVIHLMVISGLHIGFAGTLGFGLGGLFAKPFLMFGWLRQDVFIRWAFSILCAGSYAILAGLSLPTLRALIMLSVLALSRILNLNWSGWTILSLCLAIFALLQPMAALQDSFWLSFGAVVALVISLSGRPKQGFLRGLLLAQCFLLIGFGGLLMLLGKPVYLAGLLANLLAVPVTGLVLVPLILISLLLMPLASDISVRILDFVDFCFGLLLTYLECLSQLQLPHIGPVVDIGLTATLIFASGMFFVSVPSAKIRLLIAFLLWPLVLGFRIEQPELSVLVFDVGQGTSILVEQPQYSLLYDTGPAFSPQFNAGSDILLPHIQNRSRRLDGLIVSHDDSDHSGGFAYLKAGVEIGELFVGGARAYQESSDLRPVLCQDEISWNISGVRYRFLHPSTGQRPISSNNQSCVLLIEAGGKKILLAGDIEKNIESELIVNHPDLVDIDWLLVPHHGSKTSSGEFFVNSLAPDIAVVSAGYGNSFGHPAEEVVQRYQAKGAEVLATSDLGALRFTWSDLEGEMEWQSSRGLYSFWWQE